MTTQANPLRKLLHFVYGEEQGDPVCDRLLEIVAAFRARNPDLAASPVSPAWSAADVVLITYADQVRRGEEHPIKTLGGFLQTHLGDSIRTVHLLPFFPYSSDDGFAVMDYRAVDPAFGTWEDVRNLGREYCLMLDAVINHVSSRSRWFQGYLAGESQYDSYFIEVDPGLDTTQVIRPRNLPLLTRVDTQTGPRHVWTTFSRDQIDLNYTNPEVLVEITRILLFYIERGAKIIRLDAIAYLWKEIGTTCIHLPQTHAVVKIWRAVLDLAAPGTLLITETNVPHEENISYFGSGTDEAQMVYQFPLPPLVLHTFLHGNADRLTGWARRLDPPPPGATFFNFIASHDGIGLRPAEGILEQHELDALVARTEAHGGRVSLRRHADGSSRVYELNITLFEFLNDPDTDGQALSVSRFLASQAIMLSLAGIPGIYFHSLFGTENCYPCAEETGRARSLNRRKYRLAELENLLADPAHHSGSILRGYLHLLQTRRRSRAFHPDQPQRVLSIDPGVFALVRGSGDARVLCLVNVTGRRLMVGVVPGFLPSVDLLSGERSEADPIELAPYQYRWLSAAGTP